MENRRIYGRINLAKESERIGSDVVLSIKSTTQYQYCESVEELKKIKKTYIGYSAKNLILALVLLVGIIILYFAVSYTNYVFYIGLGSVGLLILMFVVRILIILTYKQKMPNTSPLLYQYTEVKVGDFNGKTLAYDVTKHKFLFYLHFVLCGVSLAGLETSAVLYAIPVFQIEYIPGMICSIFLAIGGGVIVFLTFHSRHFSYKSIYLDSNGDDLVFTMGSFTKVN